MKSILNLTMSAAVIFFFSNAGCSRKKVENESVLRNLYEQYKFGQIEECSYEGQKVYHAGINAYDAGTQVYDEKGKSIAVCNYFSRMVDAPCEQLGECEVVYRCENHISGKPPLDKYGLTK